MKVLISTDTVGYETKPTGHEADIQDRLWNHTEVVDAQALAEIITEGRTTCRRRKELLSLKKPCKLF